MKAGKKFPFILRAGPEYGTHFYLPHWPEYLAAREAGNRHTSYNPVILSIQ